MKATVEEPRLEEEEEAVPVAAGRDLSLLELDLARLEKDPIEGIAATRGVDRRERTYRRALVRGEPLLDWARQRPRDEVVRVLLAILDALGALHDRGLMLGGLQASGVLVAGGKPVIVDLARLSEEPARIEPGVSTAPEALTGSRADRRTDLHGFGTIVAALLPGEDLRGLGAKDPHERTASARAARALFEPPSQPPPEEPFARAWHGPLVGRTSRLEAVLEAARSALLSAPSRTAPGIVLVHGAPGLGRTRFLDEVLVRLAADGVEVARASGTSAGTEPLRVFGDLLRQAARPETRWSARARVTLVRLGVPVPGQKELWEKPAGPEPETAEDANDARLLLADAIASTLLEAAGGRPHAFVIDDLDRCDAGSRFVARHIARRLAAARRWVRERSVERRPSASSSAESEHAPPCVLFASTSARIEPPADAAAQRNDETGAFALDVRALAGEAFALDVRLEPLDEDALATIAASLSGDTPSSPRARELARAARGNPGQLVESVRAGLVVGSLEEALRVRVESLEPLGRSLLLALVAIGREAEAALVAAVAGHPLDAGVRAALSLLVREGLARRGPAGYSLRPIVVDLAQKEAASCQAALGKALAERAEEDPIAAAEWAAKNGDAALLEKTFEPALGALASLRADRRAAFLALAGADVLLAANQREGGGGAGAGGDGPPCSRSGAVERLLRAGLAFQRAGQLAPAQEALLRATRESAPLGPETRARVWRHLGSVRAALGLAEASHAAFRRARAALAKSAGIELARVLLAETEASLAQGELDLAAERGEAGLRTLREIAASGSSAVDVAVVRSRILALLGHVALLRDRPKEAETLLLAALAIDERHGNDAGAARTHQRLGGVALARGDQARAMAHWRACLALREKLGDRSGIAHVHANLSLAEARSGDLARASSLLRRALRIREEMGDRRGRAATLHNLGYIAACRGELDEAVRALEECLEIRVALEDRWYAASARNNLGQVLLDLGRTAEAANHLEAALDERRALGDRSGEAASLANLSDVALRRGDFALAIEREALARRMREGLGAEDQIDQLRRGARLEAALGHYHVAIKASQSAVKLAKASGLPLQEGPSRSLLGEALARAGRLDRAKRELERARASAERAGDRLTARRAEVELAALLVARGFADDARALLDSRPVPFTARTDPEQPPPWEAPPLEVQGPLRVREQLLRARIELARPGGEPSLARRLALDAASTARAGEERELEWRALRAAAAAAEKEADEGGALELSAAAQEVVEALLANVPEARRELYLRADPARAAALRGDAALATLATPAPEPGERPRIELRGAGIEDDAPTRGSWRPLRRAARRDTPAPRAAKAPVTADLARADFATITALNRRILDEKDTRRLFKVLVEGAARLCGAERAFLAFFGATEDEIEVLAVRGLEEDELRSQKQRFVRRVAKRASDSGAPVVTADAAREDGPRRGAVIGQGLRSVLAAPVRARDGRRGALYLDHRFQVGIFGARELRLVEAIADQCALSVGRARLEERARGGETPARTLARPTVEPARFRGLVGRSAALRRAIARLDELARTRRPVLISGPHGVGKELAARALHDASSRTGGPFVVLDLGDAATARDLESALRGSAALPEGALGAARGGTLLLRSLEAAKPAVADALARALDEALAAPIGGAARFVATASAPLRPELDAIFGPRDRVELPSLKDRREDVPEVALAVLEGLARERGEAKTLSAAAREALAKRPLAGEVRELMACLAAAWARAGTRSEIGVEDLPPAKGR